MVVSTGRSVVLTLPHIVAEPPCFEIVFNCLDNVVCATTCDTVGNSAANPPMHHEMEGEETTPVLQEGKGGLEPGRGRFPVEVAISAP